MMLLALLCFLSSLGPLPSSADEYQWVLVPQFDTFALRKNGELVGGYFRRPHEYAGQYRPSTARGWGEPTESPIPLPCPGGAECDCGPECPCCVKEKNYGVQKEQIKPNCTSCNGRPITKAEAAEIITKGLPDDRQKRRLTIIGTDADRARVRADLEKAPELAAWKDRLLIQDYGPTEWPVAGVGFKPKGSPAIYLQLPPDDQGRGRVIHAQHDYADGAKGLAAALRKTDPGYDAEKDPDLRKPAVNPGPPGVQGIVDFVRANALLLAVMGGGVFLAWGQKQQQAPGVKA